MQKKESNDFHISFWSIRFHTFEPQKNFWFDFYGIKLLICYAH